MLPEEFLKLAVTEKDLLNIDNGKPTRLRQCPVWTMENQPYWGIIILKGSNINQYKRLYMDKIKFPCL